MEILFLVFVVALAECRKSSYFVDENILDEVFEYEENDDDIKVSDVDYDYYYEDEDQSTIPGKAGRDYPIYSDVPITTFNCKGDTLISYIHMMLFNDHSSLFNKCLFVNNSGRESGAYYADPEARCQVFHRCIAVFGVFFKYSFLCPTGSVFNQEYNTCDWWYRVQCRQETDAGKKGFEEEELAIDVEANTNTDNDKKSTQRPILIQTIIFDEDKFKEDVSTSEFGLKNENKNIKSDEFDYEEGQDKESNVQGL